LFSKNTIDYNKYTSLINANNSPIDLSFSIKENELIIYRLHTYFIVFPKFDIRVFFNLFGYNFKHTVFNVIKNLKED
jgi:hypothetical protein